VRIRAGRLSLARACKRGHVTSLWQVQLSCGCWKDLSRRLVRIPQSCPHHGTVWVERTKTHRWHVRCLDCKYGRWFGQDEGEARAAEARHARNCPLHFVACVYDRVTVDGKGSMMRDKGERVRNTYPSCQQDAIIIPIDADEPPPF